MSDTVGVKWTQKKDVEENDGISVNFASATTSDTTDASKTFVEKISPKPNGSNKNNVDLDKLPILVDSPYYDMSNDHRGLALIFNHENFASLDARKGTGKDCKDIGNVLTSLGFDCHVYQDLKYKEVRSILDQVSQIDHSNNDCLVIVMMTHGDSGKLYAKDDEYQLKELWEPFVGDNCPSLLGKPKLIFLQACRGDKLDKGSLARRTGRAMSDAVDGKPSTTPVMFSIPTMADVLIMYATYDDHYAWRNPNDGSWFIQSLCKELKTNPHETLSIILINVTRRVAFEFESNVPEKKAWDGMKQIPSTVSMLTKSLYFTKKGSVATRMEEN